MKLNFSQRIFDKYQNIKFHKIPSIGSPAIPCGQTEGRIYMTKLIVAYRCFANTPKRNILQW